MTLDDLEEALGHVFRDRTLLEQALTHKTWLKEQQDRGAATGRRDQQRLEYLGDAFLGYEVGRQLFADLPDATEGDLTDRRRALVQGIYIQRVGERMGVRDLVSVGAGERSKLHRNKKVVEDTVEALIGAVLLDGGEDAAREVVQRHFPVDAAVNVDEDPITVFNQRWQERFRGSPPKPEYSNSGLDDDPTWTATVKLPGGVTVSGMGASHKEARRSACKQVLIRWRDDT